MNRLHGRWENRILAALLVVLVLILAFQVVSGYMSSTTATMHLGTGKFSVRVADTEPKRFQGLSGTDNLPPDEAMLLAFDTDGRWGIWMKDMNYALDIVWLDESKQVIDYVLNVPPSSYPRVFVPKKKARYVVELASGTVNERSIRIGEHAIFSGTSKEL